MPRLIIVAEPESGERKPSVARNAGQATRATR
jgi:hypothetical protein